MSDLKSVSSHRSGYKLVPPEGGWGHLVTLAMVIMNLVTLCPLAIFGLVYGSVLTKIGDEASVTALSNGIFNTVQCFTGLVSSILLKKYSYRMVSFLGALMFSLGAFGDYFVGSVGELIFYFGVLQGFGSGLLVPSFFTAFQAFFDKKLNLMMGIAQALMIIVTMMYPMVATVLINRLGHQNLIMVMFGLSLLNIPSAALLRPVAKYLKKVPVEITDRSGNIQEHLVKLNSLSDEALRHQVEPLLENKNADEISRNEADTNGVEIESGEVILGPVPRKSIISMGGMHMSVSNLHQIGKNSSQNVSCSDVLDFSLFKSPTFINIAMGLSLSFASDMAFMPLIPLALRHKGLDDGEIAFLMTVYYGTDVVARIAFSVASGICKFRNRYVFLGGTFLTAVFRSAFVYTNGYTMVAINTSILGFLRCFIQTPLPLVVMEEYSTDFSTAFSLYMVVCGVVNLIMGPLMSYVKTTTGSLDMVMHVMTVGLSICTISWIIEMTCRRIGNRRRDEPLAVHIN